MVRATHQHRNEVIKILSGSFCDNKSVNYIIKQDKQKSKRLAALMAYSFDVCLEFGEVYLSEDHKSCALLLFPHKKRTTLKSIGLDIKLIFSAIGLTNIRKALKRELLIGSIKPKQPMIYLWFIGVDNKHQNKGIGTRLLKKLLLISDKEKLPLYLETSTLKNLPEEHLLTRKEVAGLFRVSLVTLHDWMKRGLPCHKQRGRVYFLRSEILDYIKQKHHREL